MSTQEEVIRFLSLPESYDACGEPVLRIDTHGSLIFLHGERAYKLKRAIAYAALDFLTLQSRERACRAELLLNRRTAPRIYLEVRSINRGDDGRLRFGGTGAVVDWVVVMRRFAQDALFDQMARNGRLTATLIEDLGIEIARFHAAAQIMPLFGGAAGIGEVIQSNHLELCRYPQLIDRPAVDALYCEQLATLEKQAKLLEQRRNSGWVRRCHGDMRLANICLFEGHPTLFDGIEFSERIACIDVLFDLAFLLMDLRHHGLGELAERLLRGYLEHGAGPQDCRPLPLFLSLRAATRSFTLAGSSQRQRDPATAAHKADQARALLQQASAYLYNQ